jgi:hypothetical protein
MLRNQVLGMSRDQNAGWSHNTRTDIKFFERAENFRYVGKTLTDRNSIQKEIKEQIEVRECFL